METKDKKGRPAKEQAINTRLGRSHFYLLDELAEDGESKRDVLERLIAKAYTRQFGSTAYKAKVSGGSNE